MLFRPLVFPDASNGPHVIYQTWLPYLNDKPLYANVDPKRVDWRTPPRGNDASKFRACKEVLHYICRRWGCSVEQAKCISLLLRWELLAMCYEDASRIPSMASSSIHLIGIAIKQTAHAAAKASVAQVFPVRLLHELYTTFEALNIKLKQFKIANLPPQLPPFTAGSCAYEPYPFFDLVMPVNVDHLAGPAALQPIVRPVQLTLVRDKVSNFEEVCEALHHCHNLCTVMANQKEVQKNTYTLRASLIRHLFLHVIPIPLCDGHPEANKDFWIKNRTSFATKVLMMRLLSMIARHYACCCLSMRNSRSFDGVRILVAAAIVCVADRVLRIPATDVESVFCSHFAGIAEGPCKPFGINLGAFGAESEVMKFTDPQLALVRTMVLDYFEAQVVFTPVTNAMSSNRYFCRFCCLICSFFILF